MPRPTPTTPEDDARLAALLAQLDDSRKAQDLTLAEVGRRMGGVGGSDLGKILTGKQVPGVVMLLKLVDALGQRLVIADKR